MPSNHSARLLQATIFFLLLGLSYLSFSLVHKIAQSRSEESFQVLADQILISLDRRLEEYSRILDGVSGLVLASQEVTKADMEVYTKSLDVPDNVFALDAIGLATAAGADNDLQFDTSAPSDRLNEFKAAPSKLPSDNFFVLYIEPQESHEALVGFDFARDSKLLTIAKSSLETGETVAVEHFPANSAQSNYSQILLLKPIHKISTDKNASNNVSGNFLGFAFAVLNIEGIFHNLTPAQDQLLKLKVNSDVGKLHGNQKIAPATTVAIPKYFINQSFNKFGRDFSLSLNSTPKFESSQPFRARWVVLALGVFITALVSIVIQVLVGRNIKIHTAVVKKSRDLDTQIKENRCILDNTMLAIVTVNKIGEIILWNAAALKLLAHSNGAINLDNKMISELLPNLNIRDDDGWSKMNMTRATGDTEKSIVEVEKKTWFTADGEERITFLMRDITISERLTQEISEAEQRWNLALMSAQIGVFDIDLERKTSVVSNIWLKNLKMQPIPGCNNPYRQQMARIHPDDLAALEKAEDLCIKGQTERSTARFRVSVGNDEWRWIDSDAVVVKRAPDGTALRMLGVQTDVTERFKLDQMKRDFVATVSHELRTPLTSIKGAIGLLYTQLKDVEIDGVDRLINIASSNSDRLHSLVNDILDLEKLNAGRVTQNIEEIDLNKLLNLAAKQVEPYASKWNVEVEVVEHEVEKKFWADKKHVIQVLSNLLSNACKFSDSNTKVRVASEVETTYIKISVSNVGAGIPEEFRSSIFQPFSQADNSDTRQRGGTGLGLSISRRLVEDMGGSLGFESEPGKETTFWFTCPLADDLKIVRVA